ncbi:MAG: ABC transporter ATP-binding protein [bacterium]
MIEVEGLTKYYGPRCAVEDVAFRIETGEIVGLLGLNGSGKTTLLRMVSGNLLPTSGTVRIQDRDLYQHPEEAKRAIGFLPENPPLYGEMTVGAYLRFVGQLKGVRRNEIAERVRQVASGVAIEEVSKEIIEHLSFGYRQRVGIAQALIHDPELLLLDEPAAGLDPVQIIEMRQLIRGLRGTRTVILSSHFLSEISQICDRILVIQEGRIVAEGPEEKLAGRFSPGLKLRLQARAPRLAVVDCLSTLDGVDTVECTREEADQSTFVIALTYDMREQMCTVLVSRGIGILELTRLDRELENVFLQLLEKKTPSATLPEAGEKEAAA